VQLGMHVPNARAHVSKVPHVRAIMCLQDVQAGRVVNTLQGVWTGIYSAATIRLQCDVSTMDHPPGTVTVPNDSTSRRHTADRVQRGR
jgi:hypothetical protein